MAAPVSLRIPATMESLERARLFVHKQAALLGVAPELAARLDLVVEELLVNVGSYAYPDGGGDLEVDCVSDEDTGRFCLILRDWGVPFDPLARETPDIEADMDDRDPGGLGIFLVREMADHCAYRRTGDTNEFMACFATT